MVQHLLAGIVASLSGFNVNHKISKASADRLTPLVRTALLPPYTQGKDFAIINPYMGCTGTDRPLRLKLDAILKNAEHS